MRRSAAGFVLLFTLGAALSAVAQQPSNEGVTVRVTITASQVSRDRLGYVAFLQGYVDGTPAAFKCELCPGLPAGRYEGRWEKDKLRIRWTEAFGNKKVHEDKYEISLRGPKRETSWSRETPVSIVAYGVTQQQCQEPMELAFNVIRKLAHPPDWRIVMACTAASWEKASLEFHAVGGTQTAFTIWDNPLVPANGTILTVLNGEQFDHCLRPGCYVHTILHELGHFKRLTAVEAVAEEYVAEQEAALYREYPQTDFPTSDEVVKCLTSRDAACPITGEIGKLVQAARTTLQARTQPVAQAAARPSPDLDSRPALDTRRYPLAVTLLDVKWQAASGGGMSGSGRADVAGPASTMAFEFTAVCPERLETFAVQSAYKARWEAELTTLSVLADGNPQKTFTCELKGTAHPGQVYVFVNGTVTAMTEQQFKAQATAAAAAVKSQLFNADVVEMVAAGLSVDVILAKINASNGRYDTSPAGLQQLKAAHVPDAIVLEMIKRSR